MTPASEAPPVSRLWGVNDVSEYLGVPVATLYQWRTRCEGPPAMRIGRHLRYEPSAVVDWVHEK